MLQESCCCSPSLHAFYPPSVMNTELLGSLLTADHPTHIESFLEEGFAVCISFNQTGTLLAAGLNDGRVLVYDFGSSCIVRTLYGHTATVVSVSWSTDGM